VLASSRSYVDATVQAVLRLPPGTPMVGVPLGDLRSTLRAAPPADLDRQTADGERHFQQRLTDDLRQQTGAIELTLLVRAGAQQYDRAPDGTLVVRTVPANPDVYRVPQVVGLLAPWQSDDTTFRT
jgi:hypothetical protein